MYVITCWKQLLKYLAETVVDLYFFLRLCTDKSKSSKESKDERKDRDKEKSRSDKSKSSDSKHKSDDSKQKSDKVKVENEETDVIKGRVIETQGNGLKLHIKLERGDNEKKDSSENKKRASTVKRLPGRFRPTGLEEEPVLHKSKLPDSSSKRPGSDQKPKTDEPPEKKSRLHISTSLASNASNNTNNTSPVNTSPGDIHAKLKTIPPGKGKGRFNIHVIMKLIT